MPPSKSLSHHILSVTRFTPSLSCIYVNHHSVCQTVWSYSLLSVISVMSFVCQPFQYNAIPVSPTCVLSAPAIFKFLFVIPSLLGVKATSLSWNHTLFIIIHCVFVCLGFNVIISYIYHHYHFIFPYPFEWTLALACFMKTLTYDYSVCSKFILIVSEQRDNQQKKQEEVEVED